MADLPLLAAQFLNRPQWVLPSYADGVLAALGPRLGLDVMMKTEAVTKQAIKAPTMMSGGVLVMPVLGGLMHRGDSFDAVCGAQSYTNITNSLIEARDNADIRGVLMDFSSPGGMAMGCLETADIIFEISKVKPVWSIANGMAASAAYALASSTGRFYVTPSAEVGSIGVAYMHREVSKAMEIAGVTVTYIFAGDHKVDGNPFEPLPASVKAEMQEEVNESYERFVALVEARRPMSAKQIRATKARMYRADEAVSLGLADEVAPFSAVLEAFIKEVNPVYQVSPTGASTKMSTNSPAPTANAKIEGLDQALERARNDGATAARAEMEPKVLEAYSRGRADAAAIMSHEAAADRTATALIYAKNPKFAVEEATELLAAAPASTGGSFGKKLEANDPKVPAPAVNPAPNDPVQSYQSDVGAHVRSLLGVKSA